MEDTSLLRAGLLQVFFPMNGTALPLGFLLHPIKDTWCILVQNDTTGACSDRTLGLSVEFKAGYFYFTLRSDENEVLNLCPPFCLQKAAAVVGGHRDLGRQKRVNRWVLLFTEIDGGNREKGGREGGGRVNSDSDLLGYWPALGSTEVESSGNFMVYPQRLGLT